MFGFVDYNFTNPVLRRVFKSTLYDYQPIRDRAPSINLETRLSRTSKVGSLVGTPSRLNASFQPTYLCLHDRSSTESPFRVSTRINSLSFLLGPWFAESIKSSVVLESG